MTKIDRALVTELEAAAFRKLVEHLRRRTDVQNIDMMNLAGFCRNCLGDWYREAAAESVGCKWRLYESARDPHALPTILLARVPSRHSRTAGDLDPVRRWSLGASQ